MSASFGAAGWGFVTLMACFSAPPPRGGLGDGHFDANQAQTTVDFNKGGAVRTAASPVLAEYGDIKVQTTRFMAEVPRAAKKSTGGNIGSVRSDERIIGHVERPGLTSIRLKEMNVGRTLVGRYACGLGVPESMESVPDTSAS